MIIKWIKDYYHTKILKDRCETCGVKWSRLTLNYQNSGYCLKCHDDSHLGTG
jgi:hypothetical protein